MTAWWKLSTGSARGDLGEGPVELGQVLGVEGQVELRQLRRTEAELPARDPVAGDQALLPQVPEVARGAVRNSVSRTPSLRLHQM